MLTEQCTEYGLDYARDLKNMPIGGECRSVSHPRRGRRKRRSKPRGRDEGKGRKKAGRARKLGRRPSLSYLKLTYARSSVLEDVSLPDARLL